MNDDLPVPETPIAPLPEEHDLVASLRVDEHEWVVRTRFLGRDGLTRVFRGQVPEELEDALTAGALGGPPLPEALPWELRRVVEGYRLRASLPAEWALPQVLDAGLCAGHPFLSRAWVDGESLAQAWPHLSVEERDAALIDLLELLDAVHGAGVVYQDLKPDNVVRDPAGRVWVVDLESFRRTDPAGWAPWSHLSPAFAAPEQKRGVTCAASDLYTFGRLVQTLGAHAGSPLWRAISDACLQFEWSDRPTAAVARRWARGEGPPAPVTETIRVPDPGTLFESDTAGGALALLAPPAPPAPPRSLPAPPRRRWRRMAVGLVLVLFVAATWGTASEAARRRTADQAELRVRAARLVEDGRAALRAHKVTAAANNDGALSAALVLLQQAVALDPRNADARALLALGAAWGERWHWDDAAWDVAGYATTERLVDDALTAGHGREAVLAQGLLQAASCRLGPAHQREPCSRAVDHLDRAASAAADWLTVEAYWGAVAVYRDLARRAGRAGDDGEARGLAKQGLDRCRRAVPALPEAPVNNVEIARDCVVVAGLAEDPNAWTEWARWLADDAPARYHTVRKREVVLLVTSPAQECADIPLRADGWPREIDAWSLWCRAMAERALGCARVPTPKWCPVQPRNWLYGFP